MNPDLLKMDYAPVDELLDAVEKSFLDELGGDKSNRAIRRMLVIEWIRHMQSLDPPSIREELDRKTLETVLDIAKKAESVKRDFPNSPIRMRLDLEIAEREMQTVFSITSGLISKEVQDAINKVEIV